MKGELFVMSKRWFNKSIEQVSQELSTDVKKGLTRRRNTKKASRIWL